MLLSTLAFPYKATKIEYIQSLSCIRCPFTEIYLLISDCQGRDAGLRKITPLEASTIYKSFFERNILIKNVQNFFETYIFEDISMFVVSICDANNLTIFTGCDYY